jgi:hypothetical protein
MQQFQFAPMRRYPVDASAQAQSLAISFLALEMMVL